MVGENMMYLHMRQRMAKKLAMTFHVKGGSAPMLDGTRMAKGNQ
jgi:hypothetical protein